jgi:hypothetical protein
MDSDAALRENPTSAKSGQMWGTTIMGTKRRVRCGPPASQAKVIEHMISNNEWFPSAAAELTGILPYLRLASGLGAAGRQSLVIEVQDLVYAVYMIDLEHVARYWQDTEDFERVAALGRTIVPPRFVFCCRLADLMFHENFGVSGSSGSSEFNEVISHAKHVAQLRGAEAWVTSHDILWAILSQPGLEIAKSLLDSKIDVARLRQRVGV